MTFYQDIFDFLNTFPELTNLIGTGDDMRLHPIRLPQEPEFPAITDFNIASPPEYTQDGESTTLANYQFSCWDETLSSSESVRAVLKSILSGYRGQIGSKAGVIFVTNERDHYEPKTGLYGAMLDARFQINGGG